MTPLKVQAILKRIDPDLIVARSAKTGKWVVQKLVNELVWQHPNPSRLSDSGVSVIREYKRVQRTMFALPYGLTERSLDHAKRMMFWKRGVSPNDVANAMDKEEHYDRVSRKVARDSYKQSFASDYGKQLNKRLKGESTITAGISLKK